jgi:hypothetical protein
MDELLQNNKVIVSAVQVLPRRTYMQKYKQRGVKISLFSLPGVENMQIREGVGETCFVVSVRNV